MSAPNYELRKSLRVAKGRPELGRTLYQQFDAGTKCMRPPSVVEDPMLNLYVARINSRFSTLAAARYMELRRCIAKPVKLPSDHYGDPLFRQAMQDVELATKTVGQMMRPFESLLVQIFGRAA